MRKSVHSANILQYIVTIAMIVLAASALALYVSTRELPLLISGMILMLVAFLTTLIINKR